MLYFKYFLISFLLIILNSCGSGGQSIDLPEKRPIGSIEGRVLGGLYSGGMITAYTLNDADSRQFLASNPVQDDGSFNLEFATQSQPVLIEVRGGTYLDPSTLSIIDAESDFVMSKALMFESGEAHNVTVTPFTHLITGLVLYLNENNSGVIDVATLEAANNIFNELYSVSDSELLMSLDNNEEVLNIEGDERHGLLISALAKIALEERLKKDEALKDLYHLTTLNNLIYEDIRSDGVLDGKSIYRNDGGIKTLAYGDQVIDFNFYRLKLAFAMQKSLDKVSLIEFSNRNEQEDFILSVAQSESSIFEETNNVALDEIVPEIDLVSNVSELVNKELILSFKVNNSLKLQNIKLKIDELEYDYTPGSIYETSSGLFVIPVSTTSFEDGSHSIGIVVTDTFNHTVSKQIPVTFDNTAPTLMFSSANVTNGSEYLLQGTFNDEFSNVKNIIVDGVNIELSNGNNWEQLVTLVSGHNILSIGIEDELGNYAEFTTEIFFDESAPVVLVTSATLTKSKQFLLEGVYADRESGINIITVNGSSANINESENKWSKSVTLSSGENHFIVGIEDNAGNYSEFNTMVLLDDLSPIIQLTSAAITNTQEFLLEGEYIERESGVSRITVNDSDATIMADGSWSKLVTLNSGNNEFVIGAEDDAGNFTELVSNVILYEVNPVVSLTSIGLTNSHEFTLTGEYVDGDFGIKQFTVNDEDVTLLADKQWLKAVSLQEGINSFLVKIEDEAGNYAEYNTEVVLDVLAPSIDYLAPINVRFSEGDGSYKEGPLELDNIKPIYIESSHISLSGMEASKDNLIVENIPYLAFKFYDQPLNGNETAVDKLRVDYQYFINDVEVISWQANPFNQDNNEWLLPIVAETLSEAWYKVGPNDIHNIQIRVTDKAGNVRFEQANFKTQFYVPELNIQINDKLDSISNGDFATRADYVGNEVIAVNYNLFNPLGRSFRVRIQDVGVHSVIHEYEELQRENKVRERSEESWRRKEIISLERPCPESKNDWIDITALWNQLGGQWVKVTPKINTKAAINVTSDTPIPPNSIEWHNFQTVDQEMDLFFSNVSRREIRYNFDYLVNDPDVLFPIFEPSVIKNWSFTYRGEITECADVNAIQTRTDYSYEKVNGFPRNNLTLKSVDKEENNFSSSKFTIFDEGGTEIVAHNDWFEIPANQTITIKKYVKTPSLDLYTDNKVTNPKSIKDYNLHRFDKKIYWTIGQDLIIDSQFNPENSLVDDTANIKQKVLQLENKNVVFQRN